MIEGVFSHADEIACPECPPWSKPGAKVERRHMLECVEQNYSGTGEDVGQCPECGKSWFVVYKVDHLNRAEDWDGLIREQQEIADAKELSEMKAAERKEYDRLRAMFED